MRVLARAARCRAVRPCRSWRGATSPPPARGQASPTSWPRTPPAATGSVDTVSPVGYNGRTPASETEPGPVFELYGPGAKAANEASFRGFVALDVRNFESVSSRVYYNGVLPGIAEQILKDKEGAYLITGYPGPALPPSINPPSPSSQIAALLGNDSAQVIGNFDDVFAVGDRLQLAVYNGTVMQIPDFTITPPSAFTLPTTTTSPQVGPNFTVSPQ